MEIRHKLAAWSGREVLDLLIEAAYLAVIFLIPLWFAWLFPTYNIFELNKSVLLKILLWLLVFLTVVKIIFYPAVFSVASRLWKKYWLVPALVTVAWFLGGWGALDKPLSFYGTPERQAGLSNLIYYFFWFLLLSFNILTVNNAKARGAAVPFAANLRRVVAAMSWSGFLVALYAVLQILNVDFLTWPEPPYLTGRALSTFGQPNFLASWLLLVIPVGVYLRATEKKKWLAWFWMMTVATQVLGLLASGSRGGVAAALLSALLYLSYLLFSASWSGRRKFLAVFLFLLISAGALWSLDYASHGRLRELRNLDYGSLGARRNFYVSAVSAISARPWLGYGPEAGTEIFIRYYAADWAVYGNVGQLTDRAHNIILDELLSGGLWGLVGTIVFYGFLFRLAWQNIKQGKERELSLTLGFGAAAYLLSLLLSFQIVAGQVYIYLFLAILAAVNAQSGQTYMLSGTVNPRQGWRRSLAWLLCILLIIIAAWRVERLSRVIAADYYFNTVYQALPAGDYFAVLELESYAREQKTNPVIQASYDYWLGYQLSELYGGIKALAPKTAVRAYLESLLSRLSDVGYKNLFLKGKINLVLQNYAASEEYLSRVAALAPHWPLVILEQAKLAVARGDYAAAIAYYNTTAANLPSARDERLPAEHLAVVKKYNYFIDKGLGGAYEARKDYIAAANHYLAAYNSNPDDFTLLKKIADTYYFRGDWAGAIEYAQRGLSRNPGDYHWSLALAALYQEQGDKVAAEKYWLAARDLAPAEDKDKLESLKNVYQAQP